MAQRVVDFLESVQIEKQHGQRRCDPSRFAQCLCTQQIEAATVVNAGQLVGQRHVAQIAFKVVDAPGHQQQRSTATAPRLDWPAADCHCGALWTSTNWRPPTACPRLCRPSSPTIRSASATPGPAPPTRTTRVRPPDRRRPDTRSVLPATAAAVLDQDGRMAGWPDEAGVGSHSFSRSAIDVQRSSIVLTDSAPWVLQIAGWCHVR